MSAPPREPQRSGRIVFTLPSRWLVVQAIVRWPGRLDALADWLDDWLVTPGRWRLLLAGIVLFNAAIWAAVIALVAVIVRAVLP